MTAFLKNNPGYKIKDAQAWLQENRPDLMQKVINKTLRLEQAYQEAGVIFATFTIDARIPQEEARKLLNAFYEKLL